MGSAWRSGATSARSSSRRTTRTPCFGANPPATAAGHFAALFDGDAAAGEHAAALYGSHLATVPGHPCEGRDIDWMWRRDNDEFAALYARERDAAVARIRGGHADPEWDEARERDEL